jgi:hypothetical protein
MEHLKFKELYQTLQEQFYMSIPFPLERTAIDQAVQAFFKFLGESEDVKTHIDFSIAPQHRRGDVGYKHRHAEDHVYNDDKVFFISIPLLFQNMQRFSTNTQSFMILFSKLNPSGISLTKLSKIF